MSAKDSKENDEVIEVGDVGSYIKHPLQSSWSLWYFKNGKTNNWTENQKVIASFSTVEDFWAVYNYIQAASKINPGCDYSLFKDPIRPFWEDPENCDGGRWLVNLDRQKRNKELDNFWLEMLLCLIGESFDDLSEEICGAVVSIRPKADRLGLWTHDADKAEENIQIGKLMKSKLNIPPDVMLEYNTHKAQASKSNSSMVKAKYKV